MSLVEEQRNCHNCVNLWYRDVGGGCTTTTIYCEVEGVVIDTIDVNANNCKHYALPDGSLGESRAERIEWFDRNFKTASLEELRQLSKRLNKSSDGSDRYCSPEYYELCRSYENIP